MLKARRVGVRRRASPNIEIIVMKQICEVERDLIADLVSIYSALEPDRSLIKIIDLYVDCAKHWNVLQTLLIQLPVCTPHLIERVEPYWKFSSSLAAAKSVAARIS